MTNGRLIAVSGHGIFCRGYLLRPALAGLLALVVLSACVGPSLPSLSESNHGYGTSDLERKLIEDSDRLHDELSRKGLLMEQVDMPAYLGKVGRQVVAVEATKVVAPRFMVMRSHQINAFALPNGDVYITAGLIARLQDEAQLAFVLAHEYAHIECRHSLRKHENRKNSIVAAHIADLFLLGTSIAYLPALAAVSQYSRDQEREADSLALLRVRAAGYDPRHAIGVLEVFSRADPDGERGESVFSTHPGSQARMDNLRELLAPDGIVPDGNGTVAGEFLAARRTVIRDAAFLTLRAARYQLAFQIGGEARSLFPDSAWPLVVQGEARRLMARDPRGAANESVRNTAKRADQSVVDGFERRRGEFLDEAGLMFGEALKIEPGYPEAERGVGLVHWMRGEIEIARPLLQRYLDLSPNATDRLYIANLLQKGGSP